MIICIFYARQRKMCYYMKEKSCDTDIWQTQMCYCMKEKAVSLTASCTPSATGTDLILELAVDPAAFELPLVLQVTDLDVQLQPHTHRYINITVSIYTGVFCLSLLPLYLLFCSSLLPVYLLNNATLLLNNATLLPNLKMLVKWHSGW